MSFRRRLLFVVLATTTVALGGAFAVVFVEVNRRQERQLDNALVAEAREEAADASAVGGARIVASRRPGPMANDVRPLRKYGAIYAADGRVLDATPSLQGNAPPLPGAKDGECFDVVLHGELLRGVVVPVPKSSHRLLLASPRSDLDSGVAFLEHAMLAAFLVALLWAGLISSWTLRRMTRAHERIADVARRVAAGDLDARVGKGGSDPETQQLAQDLDEMIARLSSLLVSQREFIAHAAHELRSPLTSLYGELSHALRRERDSESYRRAIEEALESSRALKALAEDLLALARLSASPGEPHDLVDPVALVKQAMGEVGKEAARKNVDIVVNGSSGRVPCHAQDVQRLFRNLLENSVRHSPPGTAVRVDIEEAPRAVVVTVSDEGPGIPESDRERVFEPFYRGREERARDIPGAGLGLAIARRIAHAHGGEVRVEANGAIGAHLRVELPRPPANNTSITR